MLKDSITDRLNEVYQLFWKHRLKLNPPPVDQRHLTRIDREIDRLRKCLDCDDKKPERIPVVVPHGIRDEDWTKYLSRNAEAAKRWAEQHPEVVVVGAVVVAGAIIIFTGGGGTVVVAAAAL